MARFGIIGGGVYGTQVLKAYMSAHRNKEIELVAIADINEEILKKHCDKYNIRGYTDYITMIQKENLDAVAVVTPDYLHEEIAVKAASFGLHLLVQKPLDVTTSGALRIIKAAEENNVLLYVDFHKRFDPAHIQIKKDLQKGKLGKIEYGYAWMEDKITVPSVWFKKWACHSSPAWFLGIHFYDLLYWLLNSKPKRVYATAVKNKLSSMGIDTYDSVQAKVEFENETHFTFDTSWILPENFPSIVNQGLRLVGTKGIAEADSQDRGVFIASEEDNYPYLPNPFGFFEDNDVHAEAICRGYTIESMLYFTKLVNMLKDGSTLKDLKNLYPSGGEALVSTALCEAVNNSIMSGQIINLEWNR